MKKLLTLALICLFPALAAAGDSKPYRIGDEAFEGYHAMPAGPSRGLVLVIHDWDGLTDYEMRRADMLAAMGYEAFAVDLYGAGNRPKEVAAKKAETGKLYQDRLRMRRLILGGLDAVRGEAATKTVIMGYCFGGAAALELARSNQAKNIAGYATFHGGLNTPEGQQYSPDTPPLLIAHGGADKAIPWPRSRGLPMNSKPPGCGMKFRSIPAHPMPSPSSAPPAIRKWRTGNHGRLSPIFSPPIWRIDAPILTLTDRGMMPLCSPADHQLG